MGARRPFFVMATSPHDKEKELYREVSRTVTTSLPGVEVLALEISGKERFCVYVDHPAGVDHDLCVRVTDVLRDYLREYTVDVSSPGIERPLRKPGHFARVLGSKVALRTSEPVNGRSKFKGELKDAGTDAVTLVVDGSEVDIPYEPIVRGNLIDER